MTKFEIGKLYDRNYATIGRRFLCVGRQNDNFLFFGIGTDGEMDSGILMCHDYETDEFCSLSADQTHNIQLINPVDKYEDDISDLNDEIMRLKHEQCREDALEQIQRSAEVQAKARYFYGTRTGRIQRPGVGVPSIPGCNVPSNVAVGEEWRRKADGLIFTVTDVENSTVSAVEKGNNSHFGTADALFFRRCFVKVDPPMPSETSNSTGEWTPDEPDPDVDVSDITAQICGGK
jgi:hypothetical protein